jgi:biotin carboxyl carrier protein
LKGARLDWHAGSVADPASEGDAAGAASYTTAMPATVLSCTVKEGSSVEKGATVMVLESMKMEIKLRANSAGVVAYLVKPGQQVKEGTKLLTIK